MQMTVTERENDAFHHLGFFLSLSPFVIDGLAE